MPAFDLGRVFRRTWEELNRGLTAYLMIILLSFAAVFGILVIGGIILVPFGLGGVFSGNGSISALFWVAFLAVAGLVFLAMLAASALIGLMQLEVTSQLFSGYQPDVHIAYQWATRRFWRMVGLILIMLVSLLVGYALLILPGIFLTIVWLLAPYILVKEDLGPFEALQRSMNLTLRAFGWVLLAFFILIAAGIVLAVIELIPFLGALVGLLLSVAIGLFTQPYHGAIYEELRRVEAGQPEPDQSPAAPPPVPEPSAPTATVSPAAETEKTEDTSARLPKKPSKTLKKSQAKE